VIARHRQIKIRNPNIEIRNETRVEGRVSRGKSLVPRHSLLDTLSIFIIWICFEFRILRHRSGQVSNLGFVVSLLRL
jgi:hypothetical protein